MYEMNRWEPCAWGALFECISCSDQNAPLDYWLEPTHTKRNTLELAIASLPSTFGDSNVQNTTEILLLRGECVPQYCMSHLCCHVMQTPRVKCVIWPRPPETETYKYR